MEKYRWYDIDIPLTWTDIHSISNHPCWILVLNFSVWPKWDISAYTLSFNYFDNSEKSEYDIWYIDWRKNILYEQQIVKLQALNIVTMVECSSCFAKWYCRGGCFVNRWEWLWNINSRRLEMIRKIITDKILFLAGI